jgi:hypothetical protein
MKPLWAAVRRAAMRARKVARRMAVLGRCMALFMGRAARRPARQALAAEKGSGRRRIGS